MNGGLPGGGLLVVVGQMVDDGEGAVVLLDKEEAHHLVGEGHGGQGDLVVGALIDIGGEAVGASHNEDYALGRAVVLTLYIGGKVEGAAQGAALVKEHYMVGGLEPGKQGFALGGFLLLP